MQQLDWCRFLPRYWFQNAPTSRVWDAALNAALDERGVTPISSYRARVGGAELWIGNYPYSYGHLMDGDERLPLVRTRKRLRQMIEAARIAAAFKASS